MLVCARVVCAHYSLHKEGLWRHVVDGAFSAIGKCEEWLSLKPRSKDRSSVITGRIHVEMGFIAREKLPEFDSFEDVSGFSVCCGVKAE